MSYPGSKNEPGKALLSLASWADRDEPGSGRRPGQSAGDASALDRQMNALLAGLAQPAQATRAELPAQRPASSGRSVADLLRGRSNRLAREPEIPIAMESKAQEIAPPAMPEPARLNIVGIIKARKSAGKAQPESVVVSPETKAAPAREKSERGLVGTLAGLLKRKSSPRAQPAAEFASPLPRAPRARAHVDAALSAPAPEKPVEKPPVAREMPVAAPRCETLRRPVPPISQPQPAHPVAVHAPAPYAPPPQHDAPPQPYAPPAMPHPMPPFHPAMPAPMPAAMPQPASAHFYWPQPVMPQPWPYPPQAAWPMPAPAFQADAAMPAPQQPAPMAAAPAPLSPANDASPHTEPVVRPASHPMTAEIDAVRDQLRTFGEALRALHRARESRRIG